MSAQGVAGRNPQAPGSPGDGTQDTNLPNRGGGPSGSGEHGGRRIPANGDGATTLPGRQLAPHHRNERPRPGRPRMPSINPNAAAGAPSVEVNRLGRSVVGTS